VTEIWSELRYAARALSKTPVVTIAAVLSLALAIGANTAVFTLINGVMLRPLPVTRPEELFTLSTLLPDGQKGTASFSIAILAELARRQDVFSGLFAFLGGGMSNFEVDGELYAASLDMVSGDYFSTLGIRPFLGRFITPADVASQSGHSSQIAVLSYRCWQQRYHADTSVLGKTIRVDGIPITIVGVAPRDFAGIQIDAGPDATVPIGYTGATTIRDRKNAWFELVGRLRPNVTPQQAKAQLAAIWPRVLLAALPEDWQGKQRADFLATRIDLQSASTGNSYLRQRLGRSLAIMMALVSIVLLIACVNLANLMLARAAAREREFRICMALGARPWRLIRALLLESFLLSLLGALAGLIVASSLSHVLLHTLWTGFVPTTVAILPDGRVLGFTAGLALLAALLFGLEPARRMFSTDRGYSLHQNSRSVLGGIGSLGKALVSAQAALCILLVIGAALFAASMQNLRAFDAGYRRDGVLLMQLFPQPGQEKIPNRTTYYRELAESLRSLPGVIAVSYSNMGPASRSDFLGSISAPSRLQSAAQAATDSVGPEFFHLMGMQVPRAANSIGQMT
jgi:putative ABC transport system permease protein